MAASNHWLAISLASQQQEESLASAEPKSPAADHGYP